MVVDGYWLVRPGSESDVERARTRRRRTDVVAVIGGVLVATAILVLGYAVVLPWVDSLGLQHVSRLVLWVAPVGAALIAGVAVAWLVSGFGERRWERLKTEPAVMRYAYAYLDAYGGVPADIAPQELWDALDVPGGPTRSGLHVQIMASLPRTGGATPTS